MSKNKRKSSVLPAGSDVDSDISDPPLPSKSLLEGYTTEEEKERELQRRLNPTKKVVRTGPPVGKPDPRGKHLADEDSDSDDSLPRPSQSMLEDSDENASPSRKKRRGNNNKAVASKWTGELPPYLKPMRRRPSEAESSSDDSIRRPRKSLLAPSAPKGKKNAVVPPHLLKPMGANQTESTPETPFKRPTKRPSKTKRTPILPKDKFAEQMTQLAASDARKSSRISQKPETTGEGEDVTLDLGEEMSALDDGGDGNVTEEEDNRADSEESDSDLETPLITNRRRSWANGQSQRLRNITEEKENENNKTNPKPSLKKSKITSRSNRSDEDDEENGEDGNDEFEEADSEEEEEEEEEMEAETVVTPRKSSRIVSTPRKSTSFRLTENKRSSGSPKKLVFEKELNNGSQENHKTKSPSKKMPRMSVVEGNVEQHEVAAQVVTASKTSHPERNLGKQVEESESNNNDEISLVDEELAETEADKGTKSPRTKVHRKKKKYALLEMPKGKGSKGTVKAQRLKSKALHLKKHIAANASPSESDSSQIMEVNKRMRKRSSMLPSSQLSRTSSSSMAPYELYENILSQGSLSQAEKRSVEQAIDTAEAETETEMPSIPDTVQIADHRNNGESNNSSVPPPILLAQTRTGASSPLRVPPINLERREAEQNDVTVNVNPPPPLTPKRKNQRESVHQSNDDVVSLAPRPPSTSQRKRSREKSVTESESDDAAVNPPPPQRKNNQRKSVKNVTKAVSNDGVIPPPPAPQRKSSRRKSVVQPNDVIVNSPPPPTTPKRKSSQKKSVTESESDDAAVSVSPPPPQRKNNQKKSVKNVTDSESESSDVDVVSAPHRQSKQKKSVVQLNDVVVNSPPPQPTQHKTAAHRPQPSTSKTSTSTTAAKNKKAPKENETAAKARTATQPSTSKTSAITTTAYWGPRHPWMLEPASQVLYNWDILDKDDVNKALKKGKKKLNPSQVKNLHKNINTFLEKTFDNLCDNTKMGYGVFSFQQVFDELKRDQLLPEKSSAKDLIGQLKNRLSKKEFKEAEGVIYPKKDSRDTLDFFNSVAAKTTTKRKQN